MKQFHHAVRTVPENGNILFHEQDENILKLLKMGCWSNIHSLGSLDNIQFSSEGNSINFGNEKFDVSTLPMHGSHNIKNAVIAMYAAYLHGVPLTQSFAALQNSKGVKRRFETVFENDSKIVIDDFAHHPTAISQTIKAAKNYYSSKKILAIIELGSNTMSEGHHGKKLYESAAELEKVFWLNVSGSKNVDFEYDSIELLLKDLTDNIDKYDVILIMSNKDSKKISEPVIELIKNK